MGSICLKHVAKTSYPLTLEPTTPDNVAPMDIDDLLSKGGEILKREIRHLLRESAGNKLSPGSARDLVAYVKLLSELKEGAQKELENLTDEELQARLK